MPDWKNQFESGNEMDKNTKDDFNEILGKTLPEIVSKTPQLQTIDN